MTAIPEGWELTTVGEVNVWVGPHHGPFYFDDRFPPVTLQVRRFLFDGAKTRIEAMLKNSRLRRPVVIETTGRRDLADLTDALSQVRPRWDDIQVWDEGLAERLRVLGFRVKLVERSGEDDDIWDDELPPS